MRFRPMHSSNAMVVALVCLLAGGAAAPACASGVSEPSVMNANASPSLPPIQPLAAKGPEEVRLKKDQERQITIAPAELVAFKIQKAAIGQIAFNEDASTVIVSPFSGRVTKLIGKIGETVDRGTPLFEIDSPEVVQAQTDLIAAVQNLEKAKAQLALAKRTLDRQTELLASKATSVREADQARSDYAGAESDVRTAEGNLTSARNRLRVLVGRTEQEIARVEHERIINPIFIVSSPIPGTIVNRKVGPGQYVRSDSPDPLFAISDLSTMWLKASVPENDIPHVKVGQDVDVKVPALPDRGFKARVIAIGAASDAATRRVVVRSEIANPDGVLRGEMFATFRIRTGEGQPAPVVPAEAIILEGNDATVWIEREPLLFQRRKVKLGLEQDGRVQVLSGIVAGERVVGKGAIFVDNEWRQ